MWKAIKEFFASKKAKALMAAAGTIVATDGLTPAAGTKIAAVAISYILGQSLVDHAIARRPAGVDPAADVRDLEAISTGANRGRKK